MSDNPQSVEEWLSLAARHEGACATLLKGGHNELAWFNAGLSVECTLKAAIMQHHRFNSWPSRASRPDLYTHNLAALLAACDISRSALEGDDIAADIATVLLWRRGEGYNPATMPITVARSMVQSATGSQGVNRWIEQNFHLRP